MIALDPKAPAASVPCQWAPPLADGEAIVGAPVVNITGGVVADVLVVGGAVQFRLSGGAHGIPAVIALTVSTDAGNVYSEALVAPIIDTAVPAFVAFRLAYVEFANASDVAVTEALIAGAAYAADWPEVQRERVAALFAAHSLATGGQADGAIPDGVTSWKSGTFSVTFGARGKGAGGYGSTRFGRELWSLIRVRTAGPRVYA